MSSDLVLWVILASLATFRCASIVTSEDGPFAVFSRLRNWASMKARWLYEGLRCYACTSVWFGVFFAIWLAGSVAKFIILAFAISALSLFVYMIDALMSKKLMQ